MLEDRQLASLLLLLPFVMQPQNRFVHDAGEEEYLINLFLLGYSAQLILQGYRDFGSEESLLLLGTDHTMLIVSETRCFVKNETLIYETGF